MVGKVKKYKKYLTDPKVSVPRTTAWRKRKRHNTSGAKSASIPALTVLPAKRRKLYTRSNLVKVPRQTKWYWERKKGQFSSRMQSQCIDIICIIYIYINDYCL